MIGVARSLASVLKGGCVRITSVASSPDITGIETCVSMSVFAPGLNGSLASTGGRKADI